MSPKIEHRPPLLLLASFLTLGLATACAQPRDSSEDSPQETSTGAAAAPATAGSPIASTNFECSGWQAQDSGVDASFRGASALDDRIVWISGTGGRVGHTVDGGATWSVEVVAGAEEFDFRDVDALDATTIFLMSAGPGAASRIYKTVDGGTTWNLQHTNDREEGFFDGMAFWDAQRGLVYGDPVDGAFFVLRTENGGESWQHVPVDSLPPALDGEAGFAASGSGLAVIEGGHAWFGTGGPAARVFRSSDYGQTWGVAETPMKSGEPSTGIFSLAFVDSERGVAVGGDYQEPSAIDGNLAWTLDGGQTWTAPSTDGAPPAGFRSAVAYLPGTHGQSLITVGTSGTDLSHDGGHTWVPMGEQGFNALALGPSPCALWAAGPEGTVARAQTEPEAVE